MPPRIRSSGSKLLRITSSVLKRLKIGNSEPDSRRDARKIASPPHAPPGVDELKKIIMEKLPVISLSTAC
eukprot:1150302-Pelagomonas_calceolata.AAC.7